MKMRKIYTLAFAFILGILFANGQILSEDFESASLPSGWSSYDEDGDSYSFLYLIYTVAAHNGDGVALSPYNQSAEEAVNNWMVTNQLTLSNNNILTFWAVSKDINNVFEETLNVWVSTTGNTPADFTTMLNSYAVPTGYNGGSGDHHYSYTQYSIDLSAYAGQDVYIAWQHNSPWGGQQLCIDDIEVSEQVPVWPEINITSHVGGDRIYLYDPVTIEADATISSGVIDSVVFTVNGVDYPDYAEPWSTTFTPESEGLQVGSGYDFDARAYSNGNMAPDYVDNIVVVDHHPRGAFTCPSDGAQIYIGEDIPMVVIATDTTIVGDSDVNYVSSPSSGIDSVQFYLNGNLLGTVTEEPYIFNMETEGLSTGFKSCYAITYDKSGNEYTEGVGIYLIDPYQEGNLDWTRVYGTYDKDVEFSMYNQVTYTIATNIPTSLVQLPDNSYIMAGYTNKGYDSGYDAYIIKTDENGDTLWTKTYQETSYAIEVFEDIMVDYDNGGTATGLIAVGYAKGDDDSYYDDDMWIVKMDLDGEVIWSKHIGEATQSQSSAIAAADLSDNSGYVITGFYGVATSPGTIYSSNLWVVKLDNDGNLVWDNQYGSTAYFDCGNDITVDNDGNILVAGYTTTNGTNSSADIWLLKIDSDGNDIWNQTFGGVGLDIAFTIANTSDGGCVLGGYTNTNSIGNKDGFVVKVDSDGNEQWSQNYGGVDYDKINKIIELHNGSYAMVGIFETVSNSYDIWFMKIDQTGNVLEETLYGDIHNEVCTDIVLTSDTAYAMVSSTNSFGLGGGFQTLYTGSAYMLLKTDQDITTNVKTEIQPESICLYPNPSNGLVSVNKKGITDIKVYDLSGQLILNIQQLDGNKVVDLRNLSDGAYIVELHSSKGNVYNERLIIKK